MTKSKSDVKTHAVARGLATIVCLLGLAVIYGWVSGNAALIQIHPTFASMKFNTALLLLLSGAGILLLTFERASAATAIGLAISALAILTILEYVLGINLGIDNAIIQDHKTLQTAFPGRMSPNSAAYFVITGATIGLLGYTGRRYVSLLLAGVFGGVLLALGGVALSGYAFGIDTTYRWVQYTAMAVHTAIGFCLLGGALIAISWRREEHVALHTVSSSLIPLAAFLLVLNLSMWQALVSQENRATRNLVEAQVDRVVGESARAMKSLADSLRLMSNQWEKRGGIPLPEWQANATLYVDTIPVLHTIVGIDSDLVSRWSVPTAANIGGAQLNEKVEGKLGAALLEAKHTKLSTLVVSNTHSDSGTDILINIPLYVGEQFDGVIVGMIDVEAFFTDIVTRQNQQQSWLSVTDGATPIFEYTPNGRTENNNTWSEKRSISLFGAPLQIQGGLTQLALDKQRSPLPSIVLFAGLLITVLILGAVHINQRSRRVSHLFRQEQERFRLVVEASPSAMVMIDSAGCIEMVNAQTERIFGYLRAELLGQPMEMLIPERYRQHHPGLRSSYFNDPTARPMSEGRDISGLRKGGDEFPVEVGLSPIQTAEGIKVLSTIVDISERKQFIDDLSRRNKELDNFAYIASHDLKSPLRGVDQLATWLTEDLAGKIDDQSVEHLRLMRVRISRMERLLNDLLAYSRAGRLETTPEVVDCAELIRGVFDLCVNNPRFTLQLDGSFPEFLTAKAPLELVFRNLISNVLKHHDKDEGVISVKVEPAGNYFEFEVTDDGPGIPLEHTERAFAMFQTLRPRDEVEGSGIGLAIVKKTIEAFGGTIELGSNSPRGALFSFSWPVEIKE